MKINKVKDKGTIDRAEIGYKDAKKQHQNS
jgi:hypothetical protein